MHRPGKEGKAQATGHDNQGKFEIGKNHFRREQMSFKNGTECGNRWRVTEWSVVLTDGPSCKCKRLMVRGKVYKWEWQGCLS